MIEVRNLTIDYQTSSGRVRAVDEVSFTLPASEILGLVGESGCGKSTVAMALLGHIAAAARVKGGEVLLDGEDLLALPESLLASYRGRRIGLVPQNPAMGLSPHLRVGDQFTEVVLQHRIVGTRGEALALARAHFSLVGLPSAEGFGKRYPHELSGGQQQRVCIALAIACRPEVLVLDEPTTGLDVTTQMRIVELLKDLRTRFKIAMLYVTHDLGLLSQIADRVGVMYAGRLLEIGSTEHLFGNPRHPYTRGLIASVPSIDIAAVRAQPLRGFLERSKLPPGCAFFPRCDNAEPSCAFNIQSLELIEPGHGIACQRWRSVEQDGPNLPSKTKIQSLPRLKRSTLVELQRVRLAYHRPSYWRRLLRTEDELVVQDLSLSIEEGEIFALVGESGSGKSTIARALSGLLAPLGGTIQFRGVPIAGRLRERSLEVKRQIQYIFQNPDASLNPRERVRRGLGRPLYLYFRPDRAHLDERVAKALREVQLDPSYESRFPDQLSGGERQRVAIARGLAAEPSLILCDEVLSALDVSVQASIVDLLARLRQETGAAMLFISHDLAVVRRLADRTGVLFRGSLVEMGSTDMIFEPPFHPYTEELLLAVPSFRKRLRRSIRPSKPNHRGILGQGCVYTRRCRNYRGSICDEMVPPWRATAAGHAIRCHIPLTELAAESLIAEASAPCTAREQPGGDHMTSSLSLEQIQSYRRNGFVSPIRIAEMDRAAAWRRELEETERLHGKLHYVSKAHLVLPLAHRLASSSAVLDAVESVVGPDILLWDSTFIIKEPGDGKKVSWHQDLTYWGLDPDDIVSVWLALSPATVESGCMLMISGSHSGPIVAHRDTLASDNILSRGQTIAESIDESRSQCVVLAAGEMSLHHGRVWHGSSPNQSNDRRIGFNAQYLAPWVRQTVGDWDSALLVRGQDTYGHFEHESAASGSFVPMEVARQQAISTRRAAYLRAGTA